MRNRCRSSALIFNFLPQSISFTRLYCLRSCIQFSLSMCLFLSKIHFKHRVLNCTTHKYTHKEEEEEKNRFTANIPVAVKMLSSFYIHTRRNELCFRINIFLSLRMSCAFCLSLLAVVHLMFCFWLLLCFDFVQFLLLVAANLKYSGECVSSSWKTFSMEFSLFNGAVFCRFLIRSFYIQNDRIVIILSRFLQQK